MSTQSESDGQQSRSQKVDVVKRNWRAEVETAEAYRELAAREGDEKRKAILLRMAEVEDIVRLRYEAGRVPDYDMSAAEFHRLEAQIWLAEERLK